MVLKIIPDILVAGHQESVRILLTGGAKCDIKDHAGNTALDWASRNGHKEIVTLLNAASG